MEQSSPLKGGSVSGTTDVSPAADNPQLLKLLDESVQLMSTIVAGEHVQCQNTQAQLQSALENLKQQLHGQEMQMDRPKMDDTAGRESETDDTVRGLSDQQASPPSGPAEAEPQSAGAQTEAPSSATVLEPGLLAATASQEAAASAALAPSPVLQEDGAVFQQEQASMLHNMDVAHTADQQQQKTPALQGTTVAAAPVQQVTLKEQTGSNTAEVAAVLPCEQQPDGAAKQVDPTRAAGQFTAASSGSFGSGLPPLPPRSVSSKTSSPTKGASCVQPTRPPAAVANAQEQATVLASALSAVAAAAASQQLPVDTASDLAAALVRSASRACLAGEGEGAAAPASAMSSLADVGDQAADEDISSFAQPSVQIEAVAAALLEEQQQWLAAASEPGAQFEQQERAASQAAIAAETAATTDTAAVNPDVPPSKQAFAEALQAIAAEQLASVASATSADRRSPAITPTQAGGAPTAPPAAEDQQQASSDAPAAVLAALSNLPTGVPASSVKPGAIRRTVSASKSQSALGSTNEASKPVMAPTSCGSSLGQLLLATLQERLALPAPPAAGGSAATTPTTGATGSASELLKEAGLPLLQPIRTVSSISAESGSGSQPGTPNLTAASTTGSNSHSTTAAAAAAAAAARNLTAKGRSQNGRGGSGNDIPAPVAMAGEDLEMAKLLLMSAESAVGQPGTVLTELLGFTDADEADVMAAIQDAGSKPVQAIASYLHNIRVVNMDAALAAAEGDSASTKQAAALKSLAESLLAGLVDSYCNIIAESAAANALTSAADVTASQSVVQTVTQTQQQQVLLQPAAPTVPAAAPVLTAPPAATPIGLEQIQAQLASLLAGTQLPPAAVAAPAAPAAATAANFAAALAGLLQQLSGAAPAAAMPAAVAVPALPIPAAPVPSVPATPAGPDLATALSTALQVIAAQQQQHQQQQQNAALQLQAAVHQAAQQQLAQQQAAQQQLAQQQAAQQVAVAQQQLAQQHAAAAAQQQLAQQQAAAAAAAAAVAGLTGPQPSLDLQSLQLLASLQQQHQQQQQANVDALGHIPSSAGLMLPPTGSLMAPAGGAAVANAAVAAAAAAAGLQHDLSRMNSAAPGMPGPGLSSLLSGQLASSSVAMSLAANSAHMNLPAVSYNLPPTTLGGTSNVLAPGAPSLPPAFPQQQQQLPNMQGHIAIPGYADPAAAGHWALGGHDMAPAGSMSGVAGQKATGLSALTALGLTDGAMAGHAAAVAGPVTSGAAPSGPPSNEWSYAASRASSMSVGQVPSAPMAVPAARAMAGAATQQQPMGTPPSTGQPTTPPSAFMDQTASYGAGAAQDAAASHNAAALAQMASAHLEAAVAANAVAAAAVANQKQQQHAQQQAAAAVAAAVQAQAQQQQAQQQAAQQQLVGEMFYGYQGNAAAAAGGAGGMQGMMGLPTSQLNYAAEGVDWQLLQQQMQHAQAQQAQQQQQQQ